MDGSLLAPLKKPPLGPDYRLGSGEIKRSETQPNGRDRPTLHMASQPLERLSLDVGQLE